MVELYVRADELSCDVGGAVLKDIAFEFRRIDPGLPGKGRALGSRAMSCASRRFCRLEPPVERLPDKQCVCEANLASKCS